MVPVKRGEDAHSVIVYGVDTQIGLSLVRELGRRGVRVVAIGKSPNAVGLYSRYASVKYVLTQGDPERTIDQLNRIHHETGARFLLCVSADDILFFDRIRTRLTGITPLVPDTTAMQKVLDKRTTIEAANGLGIDTPASHHIESVEQLDALLPRLSFPVILKWSNPHDVTEPAGRLGISIDKLLYVHDAGTLRAKIQEFVPLSRFPMIQEYCPGYGLGQFFFMHEGQDLLRFQHRRIHEWPPEGGYSSLCESVPLEQHADLQGKSLRLLRKLEWSGVAMVEYRYDPRTDKAVLMEINGRFWGSYPLAYHCNAPFAWFAYQVLGLDQQPYLSRPKDNLQCRNLLVELKRLYRIWFRPELIQDRTLHFSKWRELASVARGFVNPRMRYYLFASDDIRPALQDLRSMVRKSMSR